jgi:hypothetical protein
MKRRSWVGLVAISGVLLAALALGSVVLAQGPAIPTAVVGARGSAAAITPGTAFTYQGELRENGLPVTGTYTMTFRLWDSASGGGSVSGTLTQTVGVSSGLFTVQLDYGATPFTGQRLWLGIAVNGTALGQRQEITPAPYAITAYNGVPAGYMLAGASPTPPAGYVYSGLRANAGADTWRMDGNLSSYRSFLAAVALGGKVYAIGGRDSSTALAGMESYDPATHLSTAMAPLQTARMSLAAAAVGGKLYAMGGGVNLGGPALGSVEEYDPLANSWAYRAPLPTPRMMLAAASMNGQVYTFGGFDLSTTFTVTEVFSPTANTWATKAPVPTSEAVRGAAALGSKIYVLTASSLWEYDPLADTWTARAGMGQPRRPAIAVLEGKLYAIGGESGPNVVEVYDPTADAWAYGPSITWPRSWLAAAAVDNVVLAVSGTSYAYGSGTTVVEAYTPPPVFYLHQKQ